MERLGALTYTTGDGTGAINPNPGSGALTNRGAEPAARLSITKDASSGHAAQLDGVSPAARVDAVFAVDNGRSLPTSRLLKHSRATLIEEWKFDFPEVAPELQ